MITIGSDDVQRPPPAASWLQDALFYNGYGLGIQGVIYRVISEADDGNCLPAALLRLKALAENDVHREITRDHARDLRRETLEAFDAELIGTEMRRRYLGLEGMAVDGEQEDVDRLVMS